MPFSKHAQDLLEQLYNLLDERYEEAIELEDLQESLSIKTKNHHTWLINIQQHHSEVWLSSPLTGAYHFKWSDGTWVDTRGQAQLIPTLYAELDLNV